MRIFIVLSLLGFSFLTLSQALAQEIGSIGTVECREVQLQIQNTVDMEDHYKNHGQLVKTVVHALKSAKKAKLITGKCASCIFTQFALRIPIDEQKACGPDIESSDTIETEACYLSDGGCEDLTEEECIDRGSIPEGPGTDCASVSRSVIETVACCLLNDICEDMTPEDCDAERGSIPMPSGSNCETVKCGSSY
jgi:hypothetical protein